MSQVVADAVAGAPCFRSSRYLAGVHYDTGKLVVTVMSPDEGTSALVTFAEVIGFRVLDEGRLLEFWPACSGDKGWLFHIRANGWLDQEIARRGSLLEKLPGLNEYFMAGENDCISVLAGQAPEIEIRQA